MSGVNSKAPHSSGTKSERLSLIWLDAEVNIKENNQQTQEQLRQIIHRIATFDNPDACENYITSLAPQDRLILIVSGRLGRQVVPRVHTLPQVLSIHVYCMDKPANEQWARQFSKVKSVVVRTKDLIAEITADQKPPSKTDESLAISFSVDLDNPDQSTTGINGQFVHSLLLIDVLMRMASIETDKQSLIAFCKEKNSEDAEELGRIEEFKTDYKPEKAVWWYTRQSFLFKMLNEALRKQDISALFLFRFVIRDIHRQLEERQCGKTVRVYRGQVMSNDELEKLKNSENQLISINSFFSTSTEEARAIGFSDPSKILADQTRVLFVVTADPQLVTSKPFADISSVSRYKDEGEVLFMIGCVFRLTDIHQDDNRQVWRIQLELCGDKDHVLKDLFEHMKGGYGGGDAPVSLRSYGEVLRKMGKFDLAKTMFVRALNELPANDPLRFPLYYSLGQVTLEMGEYDDSLRHFKNALEMRMRIDPSDYVIIAAIYNWLGNVYLKQADHDTALTYYTKGVQLFKQNDDEEHEDLAYLYNSIALIHNKKKEHQEALKYYEKSLAIRVRCLPTDHPEIATSHNNIGCAHLALEKYDKAMTDLQCSLRIRQASLPPQHPDVAMSYANIGQVHEAKREWQSAWENYKKAESIYRRALSSSHHPTLAQIKTDIERISSKLK